MILLLITYAFFCATGYTAQQPTQNRLMSPLPKTLKLDPFLKAAQNGHLDQLRQLPNAHARDRFGLGAVHYACTMTSNLNVLQYLIEARGLDVNMADDSGLTPLHMTAQINAIQRASYLLSHHALVNAQMNDGRTALHFAAAAGSLALVKMLLQYGADKSLLGQGKTAETFARENHQNAVADLLHPMK